MAALVDENGQMAHMIWNYEGTEMRRIRERRDETTPGQRANFARRRIALLFALAEKGDT